MTLKSNTGDHIFITPISGLYLDTDEEGEITVNRVTFVASKKIPDISRKLGLVSNAAIEKSLMITEFLKTSPCYGITRVKGGSSEKQLECRKLVEKELNILLSSLLGLRHRRSGAGVFATGGQAKLFHSYMFLQTGKLTGSINNKVMYDPLAMRIDKYWRTFHKRFYYSEFLKIIAGKYKIGESWRKCIERAGVMIGQSQNSRDLAYCFLWNMIVLEMLLTEQGDKYVEKLPERIEAFLGWTGYWKEQQFSAKINRLYKLRCEFVHNGDGRSIQAKDLLFSEELVFNMMHNIIRHIKRFPTQKDLIAYSDKIKAEKILNIKSKVQPKTLLYFSTEKVEKDFDNIYNNFS